MTFLELQRWMAYFSIKRKAEEEAAEKARKEAQKNHPPTKPQRGKPRKGKRR